MTREDGPWSVCPISGGLSYRHQSAGLPHVPSFAARKTSQTEALPIGDATESALLRQGMCGRNADGVCYSSMQRRSQSLHVASSQAR